MSSPATPGTDYTDTRPSRQTRKLEAALALKSKLPGPNVEVAAPAVALGNSAGSRIYTTLSTSQ